MRRLLNGLCTATLAASAWLGLMFAVLHRPGFLGGLGISALFVLQSLLALAVVNRWLPDAGWRLLTIAGGLGLTWAGLSALNANFSRPHFEGYAVVIGVLLILQGVLTAIHLIPTFLTSSSKVHQFGN